MGLFLELFYLYRDYRERKRFWKDVVLKHHIPLQVYMSPKDNFLLMLLYIYGAIRYLLSFLFHIITSFIRRQFRRWWR